MNLNKESQMETSKTVYKLVYKIFKSGKTTKPEIFEAEDRLELYLPPKNSAYTREIYKTKIEAENRKKELEENNKNLKDVQNQPLKSSEQVKKIVAILFEKQKDQVLKSLQIQYKNVIEKLKTIEGKSLVSEDMELKKILYFNPNLNYARERTFAGQLIDWVMDRKQSKFDIDYQKCEYTYTFKSNYEKIVENKIQVDLKGIMDSFLFKMEKKLNEVIKMKEIKEFRSQGMYDGYVDFIFTDGSKFHMSNSIECGTSKYGVSFQRFPTRFHDVTFSDGTKMMNPSEAKMAELF